MIKKEETERIKYSMLRQTKCFPDPLPPKTNKQKTPNQQKLKKQTLKNKYLNFLAGNELR